MPIVSKDSQSIRDRLKQLNNPNNSNICGIERVYRLLPPDDVPALREALEGDEFQSSTIARVINERIEGVSISVYSVRRHRRGECGCRDE